MSLLLSSTCRLLFFRPMVSDQPCSTSCSSSLISRSCATGFNSRQSFRTIYASCRMRVVVESAVVVASRLGEDEKNDVAHSRTFFDVSSEQELLIGLKKEVEGGRLPSNFASLMEELYQNYQNAVFQSGISGADEIVVSNMASLFDRVLLDLEDPFIFPSYHKAIREPFDYFMFGQNYIRPLIDFENSYVGNLSFFYEMEEKLQQGHNIILISNHQSEADPAIIALLLEKTNPIIAENMTYVAGDRVLTDILCKPFSMGRNLVCVYSKNHMYDDPELVEMKKKANIRSLKEMTKLLRGGSQVVWIAPSGGRDRPDPLTNEWYPARFDSWSVNNIRRLAEHAGVPAHFYPLALLCYNIMPPPHKVEREIGERRVIGFHGCGLSVGSEISEGYEKCEGGEEYTKAMYRCVMEQYKALMDAIHGKQGTRASTSNVCLSEPSYSIR